MAGISVYRADVDPASGAMGVALRRVRSSGRRRAMRRCSLVAASVVVMAVATGSIAYAYPPDPSGPPPPPTDSALIRPLPEIVPTPSNWSPQYPFPYDQLRNRVTDADITAMREMCQWFNYQYPTVSAQIDRLQENRIGPDGKDFDYSRADVQQQVDIVTSNLDKSLTFLDPRVHALTQDQNTFGDNYFAIYKGEQFYKLFEQLFNVNNGIKAHQPAWFTGPSVQKAKRWGSDIYRSHVCG